MSDDDRGGRGRGEMAMRMADAVEEEWSPSQGWRRDTTCTFRFDICVIPL